jgi:radical SAM superfamily enzyme YgiQ (UPF0313 family)
MRKAGCVYLGFGLESASPGMLRKMHKRVDLYEVANILKETVSNNIHAHLFLIAGYPGETGSDFQMTLDFLRANRDWISSISVSKFALLEGSIMFSRPDRYNITVKSIEGRYWDTHLCSNDDNGENDKKVSRIFELWNEIKGPVEFPFVQVLHHI